MDVLEHRHQLSGYQSHLRKQSMFGLATNVGGDPKRMLRLH